MIMVWGSNGWGVFCHLNGVGPRVMAPEEEVPPAVVLARAELPGLSSASTSAYDDPPNVGEPHAANRLNVRVDDSSWTVVTEAGEVRKKARRGEDWAQIAGIEHCKE